jgi:signal transduction histidine kinase
MGLYVSRLLSRQILEPLGSLRNASAEIRRGNLDTPVPIPSQDELGDTCRDFNMMRLELKHSRDEREAYEQSRKELIAGISHDIATPLTLVKGYSSGLLEGIATTPEKQHRYFGHIYHAACTMEQLVDSLFLFSKLELGRIPFTMEPVPIYRYFEDFTAERKDALQQQGLSLTLDSKNTEVVVSLDRMQFRRVVENIIGNSLKYKEGATARMDIHIQPLADSVTISFADHGKGVSTDQLHKIFDSFYRTDAARTDTTKGSGLGLAISKQIILGLGGQIRASQTLGGGLTISITLPMAKEDSHETDSNH